MKLTKNQENILELLRRLPKNYRHMERVDGYVRWEHTEHLDWRSVNALINKGLVESSEYGIKTL